MPNAPRLKQSDPESTENNVIREMQKVERLIFEDRANLEFYNGIQNPSPAESGLLDHFTDLLNYHRDRLKILQEIEARQKMKETLAK